MLKLDSDSNTLEKVFSKKTKEALKVSSAIAELEGKKRVTLRHLFLSLWMLPNTAGYKILDEMLGVDSIRGIKALSVKQIKKEQVLEYIKDDKYNPNIGLDKSVRDVLFEALKLSKHTGAYYIGTEHVLIGALLYVSNNKKKFEKIYKTLNLGQVPLDQVVLTVLHKSLAPFKIMEEQANLEQKVGKKRPIKTELTEDMPEEAVLRLFTKEMDKEVVERTGGIIVRRDKYINEILKGFASGLTKNVLLVGPSGVGKTYIVYDLVTRLMNKEVLEEFKDIQVLRVSLPEIIATSKFPLDIEKRVMALLNYAYDNDNVVLFFEDINQLLAPSGRGGVNLFSVIKPILETGKIKIIGTMSDNAMRYFGAGNTSFSRMFHVVEVNEPDDNTLKLILQLYVQQSKERFNVRVSSKVLDELIKLTKEYLPELKFPYKAIKVLDSIIARELIRLTDEDIALIDVAKKLKANEDLKKTYLEMGKIKALEEMEKQSEILSLQKLSLEDTRRLRRSRGFSITEKDIRNYLAEITGLPIYVLTGQEAKSLRDLEKELKHYIVAQDEAIKKVSYAVKRGRLNVVRGNRPWASFLFLGPTGVGKSELAKVLARYLFGDDKDRLIQIDMSEFMESHSVSKLIGSPPGYVGYEQGGYLTERVKENPYSVILFDEIEKAAENVLNILLQILEDGHLTDSRGETVSFKNTIIILTSNIGAEEIFKDKVLGFYREVADDNTTFSAYEKMKEVLLKRLYKKLRPELINRLDDIIIFRTLTLKEAGKILDVLIKDLNQRLQESLGVFVELTPRTREFLVKKGFSEEFGARALRRVVQTYVENSLVDYLLEHGKVVKKSFEANDRLVMDVDKDSQKIVIKKG